MNKLIFLIIIFGISNNLYSQVECDCQTALDNVIAKIEAIYPGFDEKTKDTLLYSSLKSQLRSEAINIEEPKCIDVLKKYTSFFKDRHIWILPNEQDNPEASEALNEPKTLEINLETFREKIKNSSDHLEGTWQDENYTVGILKTGTNQYVGFIIEAKSPNWKPKDIKFEITGPQAITYYLSDYSSYKDTFKIYDDYIFYVNNLKSSFIKQNIDQIIDSAVVESKINELDGFYFKRLTPKTSIIQLSNFSYVFVERIEKLIKDNIADIKSSENLIIDIRNNGGGTDGAYQKLLPFIATNTIRNVGVETLSTQGLIDQVTSYTDGLRKTDPVKNQDNITENEKKIGIYKDNIGKFINLNGKSVTLDTVDIEKNSPKQIIMLANDKTGSAAENFLLKAKQSKKVKVLGIPSSGVLDYASAFFFKFGCDNYKLLLPSYRSLRLPNYPIDNIGIQPDVYLDETVTDWVQFAIDYLEK